MAFWGNLSYAGSIPTCAGDCCSCNCGETDPCYTSGECCNVGQSRVKPSYQNIYDCLQETTKNPSSTNFKGWNVIRSGSKLIPEKPSDISDVTVNDLGDGTFEVNYKVKGIPQSAKISEAQKTK